MDAAEREAWDVENFSNAYRVWLMDRMDASEYSILFDVLYSVEFTWTLPMDANRADDGRYLRDRFEQESGLECREEWLEWDCSFLEMLVGLAFEIEEQVLYDGYLGDRTAVWFHGMLKNLGLGICTDEWMLDTPGSDWYVREVAKRVIDRDYDASGFGGIFPLKHPSEDQREVELWYQAAAYILENGIV